MLKFKSMLPFLIITVMAFYLLPLLISNTGAGMIILLVLIPLICFLCAFLYGIKNRFQWVYSIIVAAAFIPTIFIYYNSSAFFYVLVYGVIALTGNFIGGVIAKHSN